MSIWWLLVILQFAIVVIAHGGGGGDDEDSGPKEPLSASDERLIRQAKISLICVLGVATFFSSLLPWLLGRVRNAFLYVNIGNCFTSGILFGAALCHMIATSSEAFTSYFKAAGPVGLVSKNDTKYPFNELIAGGSFCMLLLIDRGLMRHNHASEVQNQVDKHEPEKKNETKPTKPSTPTEVMMTPSNTPLTVVSSDGNLGCPDVPHTHRADPDGHSMCPDVPHIHPSKAKFEDSCPDYPHVHHQGSHSGCAPFPHIHNEEITCNSNLEDTDKQSVKSVNSIEKHRGTKDRITAAWILCVALSLHSIFDGLSVGASNEKAGFIALTIALVAHKLLDGFAVGVGFYFARLPKIHTILALMFCAAMTPVGIGIGWAVTAYSKGSAGHLTRGIIISISLGSFFFVSLMELLPAGLHDGKHMIPKVLAGLLGFGFMAILAIWV